MKPDEMFKIVVQPIAFKKEHLPAVPFLSPLSTYFLHLCDITELASKLKIGGRDRRERERIRDESAPLLSLFLFSQRTFSSVFSSEKKERKGTLSRDNRSLSLSVKSSMNKRVFFPFFLSFVRNWEERERKREGARFFSSNSLRGVYITRDQLAPPRCSPRRFIIPRRGDKEKNIFSTAEHLNISFFSFPLFPLFFSPHDR